MEQVLDHRTMESGYFSPALAGRVRAIGKGVALTGVVLPLFLIGILKFTPIEVEALKPVIGGTPWLSWLYPLFGEARATSLLGIAEIITALLLIVSPWSARAGVAGGVLATGIFAVTVSTLLALPIWEAGSGGFPFLNATGSFLIKDVVLLGFSLFVAGDSALRLSGRAAD